MARPRVPEIEYRKIRIRVYRAGGRFSAQFAKAGGGRHRVEKPTERAAFEAAKAIIDDLRDPHRRAQEIDRQTAEQILAEHKVPLTVAVQDYARRMLSITNPLSVTSCATNFLAKQSRDTGSKNYKDLDYRLRRFEDAYGSKLMHELSATQINTYLDNVPGSKRTRRNHRDSLVTFFRYAQAYGSLSKHEKTAAELSIRPKAEPPKRGILTPAEGAAMLVAAREMKSPALPGLVLLAFSGSRHEEICPMAEADDRLHWKNVLWASKRLYTPKEVSKLSEDRYGPLLPNAIEWLKPFKKATGPIYGGKRFDLEIAKIAHRAGVDYSHNGFRHSFITYRLLTTGSPSDVADAAGNSIATIEKHYRKRGVEKTFGRAWFKVSPDTTSIKPRPVRRSGSKAIDSAKA